MLSSVAWRPWFIGLDQFLRLCVPFFVMLSGYGLAISEEKHPHALSLGNWWAMVKRRALKLIPLYLLWSVVIVGTIWFIPEWRSPIQILPNIPLTLLTGGADYHLYFVPMIFQLYLIFPLLAALFRRSKPWLVMVGLMGLQLAVLWRFQHTVGISDQLQYIMGVSWIGYFGLGMWMAGLSKQRPLLLPWRWLLTIAGFALAAYGWWWARTESVAAIKAGTDPIFVLVFTKFSLWLYAIGAMIATGLSLDSVLSGPGRWPGIKQLLAIVMAAGTYSYLIYVSHTFLLRIVISVQRELLAWPIVVAVTAVWLVAISLSIFIQRKLK